MRERKKERERKRKRKRGKEGKDKKSENLGSITNETKMVKSQTQTRVNSTKPKML